jgi:hypothetical protein
LAHFAFSLKVYSVGLRDLEPFRSAHLPVSPFPTDHVAFSHAIVAAYAAIENLGLEVRASATRPSRINNAWNPVVKADLEARLSAAGVSLAHPVLWTVRARPTAIHAARRPEIRERAAWSRGPYVRDQRTEVIDGIAYADWLRDRVAAHAAKKLTPSLSPYDVVNVQHVARRLLLSVLGAWPPTVGNVTA